MGLGLEVQERQVLELPFQASHAEAVRDRGVDVEGLVRNLAALGLREKPERAHVVEPVRELDHHDAQVRDHGQEHLPEGLRLLLLARDVGELADLRQAVHEVGDFGPELLGNRLLRRERVLENVVEEPDDDRNIVGLEVREDRGDVQGVNEVGLARAPDLPLVLARRKDVGPPQQLLVGVGVVGLDLLEDFLEMDHVNRVAGGSLTFVEVQCGSTASSPPPCVRHAAAGR